MQPIGNKPAWYELGFDPERGIIVRIHQAAWEEFVRLVKPESPLLKTLQTDLSLHPFILPCEENWGFGPIFRAGQEKDRWKTFTCPLTETNHRAISASFNVLFIALSLFRKELEATSGLQLLAVDGMGASKAQLGGWGLSACIAPGLYGWIEKQASCPGESVVVRAMRKAHAQLYGSSSINFFERDFRIDVERSPFIDLVLPGNACWLNADRRDLQTAREGYYIGPHNVDHPIQQLSFLAGLAAMYQAAREEGY